VDVETLEAHQFDYSAIHEMDMRNLTTALGLPLEAGNVGSDGLGSGKPAELRFALLKLNIKANQRSFATQFIEQVVRPAIRDYSPFSHTADVGLRIDDPLEDIGEVADLINSVGDYMTAEEVRDRLDMPAPDDEEIAESYQSPAQSEAPEDEGGPLGGGGGLFREARSLQSVPDNAVSISDRSEAPDDASVIEGPSGGLYYVPGDDGGGNDASQAAPSPNEVQQEVSQILDDEGIEGLENHVSEKTGIEEVNLPSMDGGEGLQKLTSSLTMAGELGLTEGVESIELGSTGDEFGAYRFNDGTLNMNFDLSEDDFAEIPDGATTGNDSEWFVVHELAHSEHGQNVDVVEQGETFFEQGMSVSRDGEWVGRDRVDMVEDEVSEYARSNPGEFVAEVFAGLALGEEYSDDVMEVYDEFDGPDSWQKWRAQR